jgi:hypothetical protein
MLLMTTKLTMQKNTPTFLAILVAMRMQRYNPMDHIQGFTRSHRMPSSGKCLHRIAPAAAMVINFI